MAFQRNQPRANGGRQAPRQGAGGGQGRKQYVTLGAVSNGKDGGKYIVVDQNVELIINGVKFTGKYISLNDPTEKFARMVDKNVITEAEAEEKIAKIPSYIEYDVVVKLE